MIFLKKKEKKFVEEVKQEEKAEKLLNVFAKENKLTLEGLYKKIGYSAIEKFGSLNDFFTEILRDEKQVLKEFKTDKKLLELLIVKVKDKIKPPEVTIESVLTISTTLPNGIEKIKNSLLKVDSLIKQNNYKIKLAYIGAPRYKLSVTSEDYKSAEKILKEISEQIINEAISLDCNAEWQRKS